MDCIVLHASIDRRIERHSLFPRITQMTAISQGSFLSFPDKAFLLLLCIVHICFLKLNLRYIGSELISITIFTFHRLMLPKAGMCLVFFIFLSDNDVQSVLLNQTCFQADQASSVQKNQFLLLRIVQAGIF